MQIIYSTGNVIFINELDIRISDFGPDQRARAPFPRQNRTQIYFSISDGLSLTHIPPKCLLRSKRTEVWKSLQDTSIKVDHRDLLRSSESNVIQIDIMRDAAKRKLPQTLFVEKDY